MIATEGLEEKLQQLLNDPDSMAQILTLAQSFGMAPEAPGPATPPPPPPVDDAFMQGLMRLMQQARQADGRQEALLCALKPYLAPDRQARLDRATELARISHLAGAALGQYGILSGKGGK